MSTVRRAQRIADRSPEILRIGALAAQRRRDGRPVIVLGAGEPDVETPDHVKQAAIRAIRSGQTRYTVLDGTAELKAAVQAKFRRENGLDFALDEINAGAGAKQVMHNAFMATLDPGDEVILAAPYWTSCADLVLIAGGRPVPVGCTEDNGFRLQAQDLEAAITPRTRWLLLNSPFNPSGAAYDEWQLRPILEVLKRHPHVWLLSDDIYEHLLYDGAVFVTAAQLEPELKDRTLTVNGVQVVCDDRVAARLRRRPEGADRRDGRGAEPEHVQSLLDQPGGRRRGAERSAGAGAGVARRVPAPPRLRGGAAQCRARHLLPPARRRVLHVRKLRRADRTAHARRRLIDSDSALCRYLLESQDVAVVPGSCFGLAPYFRISYAASDADLREACERIAAACAALH